MQTTSEGRAWLNDTVTRIVARHPMPEAERVGVRYELTSHLHSAAEARAREAGRAEVTLDDLQEALREAGGEDALAEAFVRPRSVPPARAGLGRRTAAYLLDLALVYGGIMMGWAVLYILVFMALAPLGVPLHDLNPDPTRLVDWPWRGQHVGPYAVFIVVSALVGILSTFIPLAYFAWFESHGGRTPGKKALDLRVLREDGAPATAKDAILRNVTKALPLTMPFLVVLDALFIPYEGRLQRASDRMLGTVVVQERAA